MSEVFDSLPSSEVVAVNLEPMEKKQGPWSGIDWNKPSLAVVASDGEGKGCILWYAGPHLDFEICEGVGNSLGDLGLDGAPQGISVWVGSFEDNSIQTEWGLEYGHYLEGEFRDPNPAEWEIIIAQDCPWNPNDWLLPTKEAVK